MPNIAEAREEHMAHAEQRQKAIDYNRQYNEDHKEEIKESKKNKYATDPAFREAAKKRAKDRYDAQRAIRQEIRKSTGIQSYKKRSRSSIGLFCPTCLQAIPKPPKPSFKSVQRKYLVAMFSVREVARRLGKQPQTIIKLIRVDKVLPETMYKEQRSGTVPARMWTQDQVEMLMRVFDKYNLRPPVNYQTIGLKKEIQTEWDKLRPTGINPALYTVKDEETGLLARESYELPLPGFATPSEQAHYAKKEKKIAEQKASQSVA
jgi:hypothetical protein